MSEEHVQVDTPLEKLVTTLLLIFHPVSFSATKQQLGMSPHQVDVLYMAHRKLSVQLASAIRYSVCRLPSTKGITRLLCIL